MHLANTSSTGCAVQRSAMACSVRQMLLIATGIGRMSSIMTTPTCASSSSLGPLSAETYECSMSNAKMLCVSCAAASSCFLSPLLVAASAAVLRMRRADTESAASSSASPLACCSFSARVASARALLRLRRCCTVTAAMAASMASSLSSSLLLSPWPAAAAASAVEEAAALPCLRFLLVLRRLADFCLRSTSAISCTSLSVSYSLTSKRAPNTALANATQAALLTRNSSCSTRSSPLLTSTLSRSR